MTPGQQAAKSDGKGSDDFGTILIAAVLILLGIYVLWVKQHANIVGAVIAVREPVLALMGFVSEPAARLAARLDAVDAAALEYEAFKALLGETGRMVRWLYLPVILGASIYVYFGGFSSRFRRRHTMKSLVLQEKKVWPEIAPVAHLDLVNEDMFKGKWAVSISEREFAHLHKLILPDGALDRERAARVFAAQLGPLWRGPEALKPHERALFAIFCMRVGEDLEGSLAALRRLALNFEKPPFKPDYSWVDAAIAKHIQNPLIQKTLARHAYVTTVMATLLQLSRSTLGVLATPMWIWLKPIDRRLFYVLNNVGRHGDFVEVAGVMAHWKTEKKLGMSLPTACISEAVNGLDKGLKDYCDDDYLEKIFE